MPKIDVEEKMKNSGTALVNLLNGFTKIRNELQKDVIEIVDKKMADYEDLDDRVTDVCERMAKLEEQVARMDAQFYDMIFKFVGGITHQIEDMKKGVPQ